MAANKAVQTTEPVSFFERVMRELKKLFSRAPGWEAGATATITYVAPIVESIAVMAAPAAAPAVDAVLAKIQSALAAAAVLIKTAGPQPTIETYLNAIKQDLSQIETLSGITDPATAAKLSGLVKAITDEMNAIQGFLSAAKAA